MDQLIGRKIQTIAFTDKMSMLINRINYGVMRQLNIAKKVVLF